MSPTDRVVVSALDSFENAAGTKRGGNPATCERCGFPSGGHVASMLIDGIRHHHPHAATAKRHSNPAHQALSGHLERAGNFHQGIDRRRLLAPLQFPDEVVVEVGFFGQILLAQFRRFAVKPDVFPKDSSMLFGCQRLQTKQVGIGTTTVLRLYWLALKKRFPIRCPCQGSDSRL